MRPRLSPLAGVAVALLLSSCDAELPAPEIEPEPAEVFHASDVPDGSSGSLVAMVDGALVTCQGWGRADRETVSRPAARPSTTSVR